MAHLRIRLLAVFLWCSALAAGPVLAQEPAPPPAVPVLDSIAVEGNVRLTTQQVISSSGLLLGQPTNYRDIQRAIIALFRTGQFDEVSVAQGDDSTGRVVLVLRVRERPILTRWTVKGVELLSERSVKDRVKLGEGRPSTGPRWSARERASTRCTTPRATTRRRSR